jgi:hypothetical protein
MLLSTPDLFSDFPPGPPQIILGTVLLVGAAVSGWIMFNTQRAMRWMASRGPEWWPLRATAIRLADKPAVVWLYRIDCAVVFAGLVFALVSHWLLH